MPDHQIFEKIVSGGQTGADQGALDAALELGLPCSGWCPAGRVSENGPIPEIYPLKEHSLPNYQARTKANILDSDGTLIFTYGQPTGGTKLTVNLAQKHRKPFFIVNLEERPINFDHEKVWTWGWEHEIFTLNVAGPRESKNPGTQVIVQGIVEQILRLAQESYPIQATTKSV